MATKREMVKEFKAMRESLLANGERYTRDGSVYVSKYLGSVLSLDPCGRYHHIISPNGATAKCAAYWERLETAAEEAGGSLESGEGDGLDQFFTVWVKDVDDEEEEE